ncbi:MAG TPA: hypothetical protein VF478_04005 [Anaerolineae bacterium]
MENFVDEDPGLYRRLLSESTEDEQRKVRLLEQEQNLLSPHLSKSEGVDSAYP